MIEIKVPGFPEIFLGKREASDIEFCIRSEFEEGDCFRLLKEESSRTFDIITHQQDETLEKI
jgi:hypothetical protein